MAEIRAQAMALLDEVKMQGEVGARADSLKRMMELVLEQDPVDSLLVEFVPCLLEFQADAATPVRENVAEMIGGICLQHIDYVQVMAPALLALLQDSAPGVVQRAITSGSNIFQTVFEQVALQGIDNGRVEEDLLECWNWMIRFKDAVYSLAFQPGDDDVQLLALKFVETTLLLFTPNSKSALPDQPTSDGASEGFQHLMTRVAGGHPVLDAKILEQEAYKNLDLLLDQLQSTETSSLSGLVAFAIIKSLTGITERRPYMSDTIVPILSALVPNSEAVLGSHTENVIHELKGLSLTILTSKQPGALPWREQLVASLSSMNVEETGDQVIKEPGTPTSASSVSEVKEPGTPASISSASETKVTRPSITPRTALRPRSISGTAGTVTAPPRTASPLRQIRTSSAAAPPRNASPARQTRTSSAATIGTATPQTAAPAASAAAPPRTGAPAASVTAPPRTASPARQTRISSAATSGTAPPRTASPARQARTSSAAGPVTGPPRTASPARQARTSSAATSDNARPRTASPARQTKTSVPSTVTAPPRFASPARQPKVSLTAASRPSVPLVKPSMTAGSISQNGPGSWKTVRGSSPARPRSGPIDSAVSRISSSPRAGTSVENPKSSSVIVPFPPTSVKSSVRPALTSLKVSPRPSPSSSPRAASSSENPRASSVIVPFPLTTVKPLPKPSATSVKLSPRPASPSVKAAPRSASPSMKSSARSASPSVKSAPRAASPSTRATIGSSPRTASVNVASRSASPSPAARKSLAASPNLLPSLSPRASENRPTQIPTLNGSATSLLTSRVGASISKSSGTSNSAVSCASSAIPGRSKVSPSASSHSMLKSKVGALSPSTRRGAQFPACENPQSLSSGRSESSLDVPFEPVDATVVRSVVQEVPTQRLRIASFKRNTSGVSKATEIISPEVLPAQPMTLNTKKRCGWITSQSDEAHIAYHDNEWGVPVYDDKLLFELIVLQGAQAELSWPTILARRNNFRAVFANFDPAIVAKFDEKKKLSLTADSSICFPEAKVRGAVDNAALVLKIVEEYGSLSKFLWSYVNHKPIVSQYKLAKQVPVKTPKSEALSKELLRRGFRFVGPTTVYSVMQAAGLVCDHLVTCYKYQESSAENSPVTDSPIEGEKSAESWQRISLPERRAPSIVEPRAGIVDAYPHEFRKASANASDPVWAELPKIDEAREEDLEKHEDEEAYDNISSSSKCEIPVC